MTLAAVEGGGDDDELQDFHQVRDENPGGRKNGVSVWKIVHVTETHSDDTKNTVEEKQIENLELKSRKSTYHLANVVYHSREHALKEFAISQRCF